MTKFDICRDLPYNFPKRSSDCIRCVYHESLSLCVDEYEKLSKGMHPIPLGLCCTARQYSKKVNV